eukprot:COSAG02_NODE_849_length_16548_cov_6.418384_7_plen_72_part_00
MLLTLGILRQRKECKAETHKTKATEKHDWCSGTSLHVVESLCDDQPKPSIANANGLIQSIQHRTIDIRTRS